MTDDQPRCGTCRFYDHAEGGDHAFGLCRAGLPRCDDDHLGVWPQVYPTVDWCAHHKPAGPYRSGGM